MAERAPGLDDTSTRAKRRGAALGLAALLLLVLGVLYRAPALWLWNAWMTDPYYTHGLLVAALAVGLGAWRVSRLSAPADARLPLWTLAGVPVALSFYLFGFLAHSPYLLAWSLLLVGVALALAWRGLPALRASAIPALLLALSIPTPWTLEAGVWLQGLAAAGGAGVLSLFGVPFSADLYTYHVGAISFVVTPACSGFQSAVSLLAVGAVVATVFPMSKQRRILVLALAVPLALVLNVARIVAVVGVGVQWGAGAAEGFFHTWSDGILFVAETLILLAIAGLLWPRSHRRRPADG